MDRTQEEIDEQMNRAAEVIDSIGTRYQSMSYEQGVDAALRWVIGDADDEPLEPLEDGDDD